MGPFPHWVFPLLRSGCLLALGMSLAPLGLAQTAQITALNPSVLQEVSGVRHPPQSGWLDELGRLKGGRPRVWASR